MHADAATIVGSEHVARTIRREWVRRDFGASSFVTSAFGGFDLGMVEPTDAFHLLRKHFSQLTLGTAIATQADNTEG
ncbi:MAG: hypothetical protein KIT31_28050 [Deltaproteobacteria bacterium]|nr:hypothetical protein [Deltaproteobacteria bacterium]